MSTDKYPPLPTAAAKIHDDGYWTSVSGGPLRPKPVSFSTTETYTADQMRAYADEAIAADRAARGVPDAMALVAEKYAHKLALDLECVLSGDTSRWWDTAMQTISDYRSEMNAIHERESPTFMGEPVLKTRSI